VVFPVGSEPPITANKKAQREMSLASADMIPVLQSLPIPQTATIE
jgi:hypothetical protein